MNKISKTIGINLLILLFYIGTIFGLVAIFASGQEYYPLTYAFYEMMAVSIQASVCLGMAIAHFARKNQTIGQAFLLSCLVVAIIGVSSCFGGLQII